MKTVSLLSFLIHILTRCTVNVVITSRNTLRTLQGSTNVDMVAKNKSSSAAISFLRLQKGLFQKYV